jgi:hypothetical protein
MAGPSDAVLRRKRELTRAAWRNDRRPGGSYQLSHPQFLGLQQISCRLRRGPRLSEREGCPRT